MGLNIIFILTLFSSFLKDKVTYATEGCTFSFTSNSSAMFGFTDGCLPMNRWDQLNNFFNKTRANIIFGLNALKGRNLQPGGSSLDAWNFNNAESFIRYTINKNYNISGRETMNCVLTGSGSGRLIQRISRQSPELCSVTHHIYNLGPVVDEHLVEKILNPSHLDDGSYKFRKLGGTIKASDTKAVAWVGESGGASNSGTNNVTNAFVFSFWYMDQLGMVAA